MYKMNRKNLFNHMENQSFACFFSGTSPVRTADQTYPFEVNKNFFYLTGIKEENVALVMIKGANMEKSFLFIEKTDPVTALWVGETMSMEEAKAISMVDEVFERKDFRTVLSKFLQDSRQAVFGALNVLYLDLDRRSMDALETESDRFGNEMRNLYPNLVIASLHPKLGELRSVKHAHEVKMMQEAIEVTRVGIEALMSNAKAGIREYQLEAYYHFVLNSNGVTTSFNTIAASGKNATILHYEKNNAVIQDNDLILFDLGVRKNEYCSDISRTFPVSGKFTERQKAYYELVLETNKKSIEMLKPGVTFQEFNEFGKKILAEGLVKMGKIKDVSEVSKYYYHSLGHFLGLDVHDVGNYTKPFEKGQVITVEPGLYIADEAIGIRIEDNILLTDNGHVNLSESIIKEVKDIENFMSKK